MTLHPELIGQYIERPERQENGAAYWQCLACDADARKRGHTAGSAAYVLDREGHTKWHNRRGRVVP